MSSRVCALATVDRSCVGVFGAGVGGGWPGVYYVTRASSAVGGGGSWGLRCKPLLRACLWRTLTAVFGGLKCSWCLSGCRAMSLCV